MEVEAVTLTDDEREAIEACEAACRNAAQYGIEQDARRAAVLRDLLARSSAPHTSGGRNVGLRPEREQ